MEINVQRKHLKLTYKIIHLMLLAVFIVFAGCDGKIPDDSELSCVQNTDCREDHICEDGECVEGS